MIYGTRSNGNNHGLVLTKPLVVKKMLDLTGYVVTSDLSKLRITEPSAGDGAFAVLIIDRLYSSSIKYGFNFQEALSNITLYEIDPEMVEMLSVRVDAKLKQLSAFRPETMIICEDFLLCNSDLSDIVNKDKFSGKVTYCDINNKIIVSAIFVNGIVTSSIIPARERAQ